MAKKKIKKSVKWYNIALPILTPAVALAIAIPVTWKVTKDHTGGGDTPEPTPGIVQHTITYDDCHKDGSTITTVKVNDDELTIMVTPEHRDEQGFLGWKEVKQDGSPESLKAPYFDFKNRTITQDFKLYGWWKYKVDVEDDQHNKYFLPVYIDGVGPYVKWNPDAIKPDYKDFNMVLPKQLDGKDIIGVAPYGFSDPSDDYHLDIRTISLPDSIKVFSDHAFNKCSNLRIINFPKNLFSIQPFCFNFCSKISDINLNEGLERIEEDAFNCYDSDIDQFLKNVTMPSTLKYIGRNAFYYNAMEKLDMSKCGNVEICDNAFNSCWYLKNLILPEKLERIPNECFYKCNSLRYLNIPKGVKSIGYNAFDTCSKIRQITIADESELLWIGADAFANCYSLEKINLPYKLKYFEYNAFKNCYTLNNVSFANIRTWVCSDGEWTPSPTDTYENAKKIKQNSEGRWTIKPGTKLEPVGDTGQYNFSYLTNDKNQCYIIGWADYDQIVENKTFNIPAKITDDTGTYDVIGIAPSAFAVGEGNGKLTEVVFEQDQNKSNIQYICKDAFLYNSDLVKINLDVCKDLKEIGDKAFYCCFSPTAKAADPIPIDLSGTKVEYIGDEAFYAYSETYLPPITTINLPKCLKTLGEGCFYGLKNLTSIDIPEKCELSKIKYHLDFKDGAYVWFTESIICGTKVSKLDLSNTKLTYIAQGTFQDLTNTNEIVLPEGLLEIASKAFSMTGVYQSNLRTINIPKTCLIIGANAFSYCAALNNVTFVDNTSQWYIYDATNPTIYDTNGKSASDNATALKTTYVNKSWIKI